MIAGLRIDRPRRRRRADRRVLRSGQRAAAVSADSVSLAREILESSHVAVTPGAAFGTNAEGYLRFSYASSLERIQEGLSRLGRFLASRS